MNGTEIIRSVSENTITRQMTSAGISESAINGAIPAESEIEQKNLKRKKTTDDRQSKITSLSQNFNEDSATFINNGEAIESTCTSNMPQQQRERFPRNEDPNRAFMEQ